MVKIHDKITLGVVAGVVANTIKIIIEYIVYRIDRSVEPLSHLASTTVLPVEPHDAFSYLVVGTYADYAIAGILGILAVYFLMATSTRQSILKGIVIGSAAWLLIYIPAAQLNITAIDPTTVSASIFHLIYHLILGVIIVWAIAKVNHPSLK